MLSNPFKVFAIASLIMNSKSKTIRFIGYSLFLIMTVPTALLLILALLTVLIH